MLCSLLSMTEVIMLEITSSLQKSSRKLKRSMAVLAHVAVLRETSYETTSGGRRPRVLERLSALKLHTDSFFVSTQGWHQTCHFTKTQVKRSLHSRQRSSLRPTRDPSTSSVHDEAQSRQGPPLTHAGKAWPWEP